MIYLSLSIKNPFKHNKWKSILQKDYSITKNKTLEVGFYKYGFNIFELTLDLSFRGSDHSGPSLELNVFTYCFRLGIYDNRHWDLILNKWEEHEKLNSKTNS